jgi:hypothetical protein
MGDHMWLTSLKRFGKLALFVCAAAFACSLAYAAALISSQYKVSIPAVTGGSASTVSANYKLQSGVLGQSVSGSAHSSNYSNAGGFSNQSAALSNPPAANLSDAYVYPNPFKPNSPGSFQAAKLTFKHLPATATIKIFAVNLLHPLETSLKT